jgi:hypothetical protein
MKRGDLLLRAAYSIFFFFHSVKEEEECWTGVGLFFVIAVSETSFHIVVLSRENLDFIKL